MIGSQLLRYDKNQKYLLYDLETEALNCIYSKPWQISYCVFTLNEILLENTQYIWWPKLKVSKRAAEITHFDFARYKSLAHDPEIILKDFEKYLLDENIINVGHNVIRFDTLIHNVWRRELKLKEEYSYLDRCLDTVCIARAYKKGWKIDSKNRMEQMFKLSGFHEKGLKVSLSVISKDLNISFQEDGLHNAKNDVILNIEVFKKLLWLVEI